MTGINLQINDDNSFSPWEESFINLAKQFQSNKQLTSKKLPFLTLDYSKTKFQHRSTSVKRILSRPFLTPSRINFQSKQKGTFTNKNQSSSAPKTYQGPRITFYSKMNPKCLQKSKLRSPIRNLSIPQRCSYLEAHSFVQADKIKDQKHLIIQNEYKNIITKKTNSSQKLTLPINESKKKKCASTKIINDNQTMKRLKLLYHLRKLIKFD